MGRAGSAARQGGEDRLQGSDHPGGRRLGRRSLAQRDRGLRLAPALEARAGRHQDPHGARLRLHARRVQREQGKLIMAARSLRAHLLRMLLPPIAALLVLGALVAYYPSIEPATTAYDQGLIDVGISLGTYIRAADAGYRLELPVAVDQVLRRDSYDSVYYRVLGPGAKRSRATKACPHRRPIASGAMASLRTTPPIRARRYARSRCKRSAARSRAACW